MILVHSDRMRRWKRIYRFESDGADWQIKQKGKDGRGSFSVLAPALALALAFSRWHIWQRLSISLVLCQDGSATGAKLKRQGC